jgi:hypothetical protein
MLKADPPAVAELGERLVSEGVGALTVKVSALEATPPGLRTVMLELPGEAITLASTGQTIWVALTKEQDIGVPFHRTTDALTNPVPFTVRVKGGPPAVAELGERLVSEGVGALMVKVSALEVSPPGLRTVTLALPGEAIRLAATEAVNWLPLT